MAIATRVEGANLLLGPPTGSEDCIHKLWVRVIDDQLLSTWQPTPEELVRLNKGASIQLWILGHLHPPVHIDVAALREDEEEESLNGLR